MSKKMTAVNKIRAAAFKLRGGLWTALFLGVFFLAEPVPAGALPPVCSLWPWGRGSVSGQPGASPATGANMWGPSALSPGALRPRPEPLYIGNGLIGAGWGLLAGWKPCFCSPQPSSSSTDCSSFMGRILPAGEVRPGLRTLHGADRALFSETLESRRPRRTLRPVHSLEERAALGLRHAGRNGIAALPGAVAFPKSTGAP